MPNLDKVFKRRVEEETLPKALYEAAYSVIINRQKNITRKENYWTKPSGTQTQKAFKN